MTPLNTSSSAAALIIETSETHVEPKLVDEYKKLKEKCDVVISKIKTRKNRGKINDGETCSHQ